MADGPTAPGECTIGYAVDERGNLIMVCDGKRVTNVKSMRVEMLPHGHVQIDADFFVWSDYGP